MPEDAVGKKNYSQEVKRIERVLADFESGMRKLKTKHRAEMKQLNEKLVRQRLAKIKKKLQSD
jgi:hypothetical protein